MKSRNLLPPYLSNSTWTSLTDCIDTLFADVDSSVKQLRGIRDPYVVGPIIRTAIANGTLFDLDSSEYQQDVSLLLKQLAFVGMPLKKPGFLTSAQLLLLFRHTAEYWYSKGTPALVDFLNYILGSELTVNGLWTSDYKAFYTLASGSVGTAVSSGGTWYPTPHVELVVPYGDPMNSVSLDYITQLFNDVFNYNLVLDHVSLSTEANLANGNILALGLYTETIINQPLISS
jgi:hypothetical protein